MKTFYMTIILWDMFQGSMLSYYETIQVQTYQGCIQYAYSIPIPAGHEIRSIHCD